MFTEENLVREAEGDSKSIKQFKALNYASGVMFSLATDGEVRQAELITYRRVLLEMKKISSAASPCNI